MQSACRGWRRLLRRKGSPRKQKASLSCVSCAGKDCCLDVDVIVEVFGHSYDFNSKQLMWSKQATPGPLSMIATTLCGPGLHKLWYPGIRDTSTWSKFGAHGEHGDVFLFSNLGAL